ncbi:MAG: prepilin peptidase [Candidatus Pacebacteria bacterium]|nr:prepilin peptidase [Candidatus Paceibacterota bacterium]
MEILFDGVFVVPIIFIFGLVIGSFLNVVIYRYNSGTTLGGRSMCFSCGKTLRWYELIPVVSFALQLGKCRRCKSRISWQYPLVEILTGCLFVGAYFVAEGVVELAYLIIQMLLLVVIAVYDLRHKIIPNLFVYSFSFLAFGYIVYQALALGDTTGLLVSVSAGPVCFLPFAALWYFSRGTWMGFGDAKLALGIGWFLGLSKAYVAIMLAFWIGTIVGLSLIVYGRITGWRSSAEKVTMKSEIPFGPFLILGLLSTIFFEQYLNTLLSLFIFY